MEHSQRLPEGFPTPRPTEPSVSGRDPIKSEVLPLGLETHELKSHALG